MFLLCSAHHAKLENRSWKSFRQSDLQGVQTWHTFINACVNKELHNQADVVPILEEVDCSRCTINHTVKAPLYSCQSYLVGWPTNLPTGYNNLFSFGLVGKCPLTMYLHLSGTDIQQCSATFWQLWHMTPMCRQFLDLCSIKSWQLSWLRPLDGNVKKEWYWAWNLFTRKPTLIIHSSHFPEELNCW